MKKVLLVSISFLLFGLAPLVTLAQGFVPLAPIPGLTDIQPDQDGLAAFFNNLYKYLIGLSAVLAIIMIIWGGLEYSTQDSVSKKSDGKERIYQAIFGLVLVLSPVLVFSIVNPSILNLSLNLDPLKTTPGTSGGTASGTGTQATDTASGCSVSGTAGILEIATCPSDTAATIWGKNCTDRRGILSISVLTNNADGTKATSRSMCLVANTFEFIDVHTSASASSINRLQPLATASGSRINAKGSGTDAVYPNNGSNAVQFANACQSIGWKTCISDRPLFSFSHACDPLPKTTLPAAAPSPAQCYTESLNCVDTSFLNNDICSSNPGWVPFQ